MLKQTSQETQKREVKHSLIVDFFFDLSKSMPNVTANKTKTGFKLQPKFIVTLRRLVSLTQEYWTWLCEIFVNTEPRTSSHINFYFHTLTDNEMACNGYLYFFDTWWKPFWQIRTLEDGNINKSSRCQLYK